ncbi:MAG: putative transposase, partial [Bacteroidia bacterium]
MTQARKRLVSYSDTVYYHCVSRCVRRAFLCGKDSVTGFDFEHRRGWIVKRMTGLADIFAIDLCAYAVMSNHYHVVIRINTEQAAQWSDRQVAERWLRLFSGPMLVQRWMAGTHMEVAELSRISTCIEQWRERLLSLSWFMRCLNEHIARMANREDRCTGRFWEGRFKSQALLDEKALLTCMAYVDLNPIRAAMANTPEQSDFTSIQQRIEQPGNQHLRPFSGHSDDLSGIPYALGDYLELVDWAVYQEFERISERGGVLGAMDTMYQRSRIQEESMYYEHKKHDGSLPLVGVNTFLGEEGKHVHGGEQELMRSTTEEKDQQ